MPRRIQQRRTKGWRKPAGAVAVGRGTRWGNPYRVEDHGRERAIALHRAMLERRPDLVKAIRTELRGKDLMCWCTPEEACHADTLLRIANG